FVVPAPQTAPTGEELKAFLTERLAKYKVPKFFDIVDSLPRPGSGKVHKVSLRRTNALGAHANADASTTGPATASPTASPPTAPTKDHVRRPTTTALPRGPTQPRRRPPRQRTASPAPRSTAAIRRRR